MISNDQMASTGPKVICVSLDNLEHGLMATMDLTLHDSIKTFECENYNINIRFNLEMRGSPDSLWQGATNGNTITCVLPNVVPNVIAAWSWDASTIANEIRQLIRSFETFKQGIKTIKCID